MRKLDDDNSGAISFEEFTEAIYKGVLNDILHADHAAIRKKSAVSFASVLAAWVVGV